MSSLRDVPYARASLFFLLCLMACVSVNAQSRSRITQSINDDLITRIPNTTPALIQGAIDLGPMDSNANMGTMLLVLNSSASQERALELLLSRQQNKNSVLYHRWLSPEEFGQLFGTEQDDLNKIASWLESQGFSILRTAPGRRILMFQGNVWQVENAFHIEMHRYLIQGEEHYSNSNDISVPSALKDLIVGVASLNDFRPTALHNQNFQHYIGPGDFAVIYNTLPLLQAGKDGNQQTIAILGLTDIIQQSDPQLRKFRQLFLPLYNANDANVIPVTTSGCNDPYSGSADEQLEAYADLEWAGAVAPRTTLAYVPTADIACGANYVVQSNIASVLSLSYGTCEADLGTYNQIMSGIWQQAAAQGITVFVAAGDSGAAGCDLPTEHLAIHGYAVNGYASTPYNVAVGGTQFNEGFGYYWGLIDRTIQSVGLTWTSALGHIPEIVWNESPEGGLYAGGGGVSRCYGLPGWQNAPGVPSADPIPITTLQGCPVASQHRYMPDISLSAAGHDAYMVCNVGDSCSSARGTLGVTFVRGTSLASPAFAGIQAIIDQQYGRQGQANYVYYGLASQQNAQDCNSANPASYCAFYDITVGSNGVPCQVSSPNCSSSPLQYFPAGLGYDLASGLGSVNANNLFHYWDDVPPRGNTTSLLVANPATITSTGTTTLTATVSPVSGQTAPTGTVQFALIETTSSFALGTASLMASGSNGVATLHVTGQQLPVGTNRIKASYSGDTKYIGSTGAATVTVRAALTNVTTLLATNIGATSALLNGTVNPEGDNGGAYFEWSTDPTLTNPNVTCQYQYYWGYCPVVANYSTQAFSYTITGLARNTRYYFRMVFYDGTRQTFTKGATLSFTTTLPVVTTLAATSITGSSALLNGTVNPEGDNGGAYFEWGTDQTLTTPNVT